MENISKTLFTKELNLISKWTCKKKSKAEAVTPASPHVKLSKVVGNQSYEIRDQRRVEKMR